MTNKERIEKFKNEKIAANCKTEEEAKEFVKWCYANGFKWDDLPEGTTFFDDYKNETCYVFDFGEDKQLEYGYKDFYEEKGYEIIKYKDFMEEKEMTNLEYYVSKGIVKDSTVLCNVAHVCKYGGYCNGKSCFECEFDNNVNLCVKTLLEEHEEHIKLKQWEYDLIKANLKTNINPSFNWYADLCKMKEKGYFKGVYDTSVTLREILNNCKIVPDDYDFGE